MDLIRQWRNRYSIGLAINRLWVKILLGAKAELQPWASGLHLYAPVTKQYNLVQGGDALLLGR